MIVASQPVYSAARFARALFRLQIKSSPSGDIRRNCPLANSFGFCSYANRPILHYFGANKSFRFRSYGHSTCNPFIIRSYENPGGWHPLPSSDLHGSQATSHKPRPSCAKAQKCPPVSPLPAILTHSPSRKSFLPRSSRGPCRSYANTRGVGIRPANFFALGCQQSAVDCGPPFPLTTFRINTCISVASKRLYLPLKSTLMKKPGEGGAPPMALMRPEIGEGRSG